MSNEESIRSLIETWARAVSTGDRKAILAHHSPDLVMFDFPNEIRLPACAGRLTSGLSFTSTIHSARSRNVS